MSTLTRLCAAATLAALPVATSLLPTPVEAAEMVLRDDARHPGDFSLYGVTGWYRSGIGLSWAIPVAPKGFIPRVNDAFFIEFGPEFTAWYGYGYGYWGGTWPGLVVQGGVRYQFYINSVFAPYVAIKGGVVFDFDGDATALAWGFFNPRVGFQLTFTPKFAMRFDFGYWDVGIGCSWMF